MNFLINFAMASSSKKRKGKSVQKFDSSRSVSEDAHKRYDKSVQKRNASLKSRLCVTVGGEELLIISSLGSGRHFVHNPLLPLSW